jgi:hypothetical protein
MNAGVLIGVLLVAASTNASDDDWRNVRRLEPGTTVIVSVEGAETARGSFISSDPTGLELAIDGPSPARVVKRFERAAIVEVKTPYSTSNPVGCAFAGYFGGGFIGAFPGLLVGGAIGRDTGPALVGMMAGWSIGGVHVYRRCRTHPERVIYSVAVPGRDSTFTR